MIELLVALCLFSIMIVGVGKMLLHTKVLQHLNQKKEDQFMQILEQIEATELKNQKLEP